MKLTTHFSLDELTVSETAARLGIFPEQFDPPPEIVANLAKLAGQLEILRAILGSNKILVSSGYRCPRLNAATEGSSKTSAHMLGLAADFIVPGFGPPLVVCRRVVDTKHFEFDQVIFEYGRWCHLGVGPGDRRQALSKFAGDKTYYPGIIAAAPAKEA